LTLQSVILAKALLPFNLSAVRYVRIVTYTHALLTCYQVADKFPDVDNYSGRWPVMDLMKLRLKNTSSKHRKLAQKVVAGKSDDPIVSKKARKSKVQTFRYSLLTCC